MVAALGEKSERRSLRFMTPAPKIAAVLLFLGTSVFCAEPEPWERPWNGPAATTVLSSPRYCIIAAAFGHLTKFYQKKISPKSIERCPFHTGCSNFFLKATERHGPLMGICIFLDRYYFRENPSAAWNYRLTESDGALKVDDSMFYK